MRRQAQYMIPDLPADQGFTVAHAEAAADLKRRRSVAVSGMEGSAAEKRLRGVWSRDRRLSFQQDVVQDGPLSTRKAGAGKKTRKRGRPGVRP